MRVDILDVALDPITTRELIVQVGRWIAARRTDVMLPCRQVCTVNPEFVMDARRMDDFAAVLAGADLCVADGVGILAAGLLLGTPFPQRVTGSDGIYLLCEAAARQGWRVFFLGAGAGVAAQAARILAQRYPGLTVAGSYAGSPAPDEWPGIRARLQTAAPDLLFVAYGHPRQDFWIHRHRHELPAAVAIGVGGAFDFVAGVARRAPLGWQRLGLEWLYRLLREPWRWRRMARLPLFAGLVVSAALRRRLGLGVTKRG